MPLADPTKPGMDKDPNPNPNQTKTNTKSDGEPKGSFQDRLNQITRRASDAERVAAQTITENTELREQLGRLESQIQQLSARPAAPASTSPEGDLSRADVPGNFEALAAKIKEDVLGVVKPVLDEFAQSKAEKQLAVTQKQSFDRAAKAHPELRDPDSKLFQTFEKLWDGRPDLQGVDGSPEILAEAARGLLTEARATEQVRKMAAAADTPKNPRKLDEVDTTGDIDDAVEKLVDVGKNDGWGNDDMDDYLALQYKKAGFDQR